jgi:hypothetical protein
VPSHLKSYVITEAEYMLAGNNIEVIEFIPRLRGHAGKLQTSAWVLRF